MATSRIIHGLDELRALSGAEAGVSSWHTVTQDMINQFASLTGDQQWIHSDPARCAAESPFHTTIAHGFLTVALLSELSREAVDVQGDFKLRINYGFNRLRFPAPVPSGSRIRAHFAVGKIEDTTVTWLVTVEVENSSKPALAAEWLIRYA
jgi:acyl dehydratase